LAVLICWDFLGMGWCVGEASEAGDAADAVGDAAGDLVGDADDAAGDAAGDAAEAAGLWYTGVASMSRRVQVRGRESRAAG
jgi:hypothetical protein